MSNDTLTALIDALRETPRMTAPELGVTNADMKALQARGLVVEYGTRVTGKRGRPPIEWVIAGTEVSDTAAEAVEDAQAAVDEYYAWSRSSDALWRMREAGERNSEAYATRYCDHYDRWPMGEVPRTPTDNEMLLAGVTVKDEPLSVPEVDDADLGVAYLIGSAAA